MSKVVGTSEVTTYRSRPSVPAQAGHFLAHLGEMILAMAVGMVVSALALALIFVTLLVSTVREMTQLQVFNEFAVLICLVVAIGMTATMVGWMRYRGMEWRPVLEMATAMTLPLVPIFGLLAFRVIPGASACGLYCALMIPAMVVVMLFRLDLYAGRTTHHGHTRHVAQAA